MSDGLNPEQRAAVLHTDGPLLILAGAGTGKTRVITERAAFLVRAHGVAPGSLLNVTFTNKAAREMRERIERRLGDGSAGEGSGGAPKKGRKKSAAAGMTVCTFHALGSMLLRQYADRLGMRKDFRVYARAEQITLVRTALRDRGEETRKPEQVQQAISSAKTTGDRPKPIDDASVLAELIFDDYERMLRHCNAVDFDDLLLLTRRLLEDDAGVRDEVRERFRYVQVDEYQDTNAVQLSLLRSICFGHKNIAVVGDDDQSIYAWRGAEVRNILQFDKSFGSKAQPVKVIRLEQNYRSSANILNAANAVIANNPIRAQKTLRTDQGSGFPVRIVAAADDTEEARVVCDHIERYKGRGDLLNECAILFRQASLSRPIEEQLRARNLPYTMIGGQKYFDRKEVRDALSYLSLLVHDRDDAAMIRVINYPSRGIGSGTMSAIAKYAESVRKPMAKAIRVCETKDLTEHGAPAAGANAVVTFADLLRTHRNRLEQGEAADVVADSLLNAVGLEDEIGRQHAADPVDALRRQQNIRGVVTSLRQFMDRIEVAADLGRQPTMRDYLERIALQDESDNADKATKLGRENVILITIHSCKGLEFKNVFVVGMEEGIIPHSRSEEDVNGLDEERRLAYVAMTRAMERLTMTYTVNRVTRGRPSARQPSRFLTEIPVECLETEKAEIDKQARFQSFLGKLKNVIGDSPG